jgi:hypothetical protein
MRQRFGAVGQHRRDCLGSLLFQEKQKYLSNEAEEAHNDAD